MFRLRKLKSTVRKNKYLFKEIIMKINRAGEELKLHWLCYYLPKRFL